MSVLILGGAGVFGSRLAELLVEDGHRVIVAGRTAATLEALATRLGVEPLVLDRADVAAVRHALTHHEVTHLIDAAGPFQNYAGYDVAEAAIEAGCHYLDLSDDAAFTAGISTLEERAEEAGVAVLSGVSSVPAISGAVVTGLTEGWRQIHHIEAAIMPGNRAPRGRSVMEAILGQVGEPLRLWQAGRWEEAPGWSDPRMYDLPGAERRQAALIGAPDLRLFPTHFRAATVEFRAGLELGIMQQSLALWSWLRRRKLVPNAKIFRRPLHRVATMLDRFGSDRGGMVVRVIGVDGSGALMEAWWVMSVGAGKGPYTPALPAAILVRKDKLLPGARAAISEFSKAEIEEEFKRIGARTTTEAETYTPLFQAALGAAWAQMPPLWRATHTVTPLKILEGEARITRGVGLLSRIIGALFRFPKAAEVVPVTVRMVAKDGREHWTRRFGESSFTSVLRGSRPGHLRERFGPFEFEMAVPETGNGIEMPVTRGWFCGVPMPKALLPRSETREFIQDDIFHFDVRLSAPLAGLIVHYQGWLK